MIRAAIKVAPPVSEPPALEEERSGPLDLGSHPLRLVLPPRLVRLHSLQCLETLHLALELELRSSDKPNNNNNNNSPLDSEHLDRRSLVSVSNHLASANRHRYLDSRHLVSVSRLQDSEPLLGALAAQGVERLGPVRLGVEVRALVKQRLNLLHLGLRLLVPLPQGLALLPLVASARPGLGLQGSGPLELRHHPNLFSVVEANRPADCLGLRKVHRLCLGSSLPLVSVRLRRVLNLCLAEALVSRRLALCLGVSRRVVEVYLAGLKLLQAVYSEPDSQAAVSSEIRKARLVSSAAPQARSEDLVFSVVELVRRHSPGQFLELHL